MTTYDTLRNSEPALEFVRTRPEFSVTSETRWASNQIAIDAHRAKNGLDDLEKDFPAFTFWRIATYVASAELDDGASLQSAFMLAVTWFSMMWDRHFIPGGQIIRGAGNPSMVSLINCTTVGIFEDSIDGIYDAAHVLAKVGSRGEGTGVDVTPLRPKGAVVHNAARHTSGAVSWMPLFDLTTGTIAQEGRRGALLISIQISHPEVPEFIKVKSNLKAIQNANISLQITDDFMQAVLNDEPWTFHWESADGKLRIEEPSVPARDIMRMLSEHSSKFAEPGLQFLDTARRYSNSDPLGYPVISTNACSEQWLTHLDSCVLGHQNWATLPLEQSFAEQEASSRAYFVNWFLDNVVTKQIVDKRYPLPESGDRSALLRRVGGGMTGMADYFALRGITYGSDESIAISKKLTRAMAKGSYERSILAGRAKGSFPAYDEAKFKQSQFVKDMIADGVLPESIPHLRNVCNLTVAPVGTGMILVDGFANGVEQGLFLAGWRRTRISGQYVWYFVVNPFTYTLIRDPIVAGRIRLLAQSINEIPVGPERIEMEDKVLEILAGQVDLSLHKFGNDVDPMAKAKLMGAVQRYIDSSISVTFNLPGTATVEDIEALYVEAWRQKLKGVAIYREDPENREPIFQHTRPSTFNYAVAPEVTKVEGVRVARPRPDALVALVETAHAEGHKFYFTYGFDSDGNLYEVFANTNSREPKISTEAAVEQLLFLLRTNKVDEAFIKDQQSKAAHQNSSVKVCRLVSLALRHGIGLDQIVQSLERLDVPVSSYIYHLRRGLQQFHTLRTMVCPNCGDDALIVSSGCKTCASCGTGLC